MSGICKRCLTTRQNVFIRQRKRNFITSSVSSYVSFKEVNNNFNSEVPVKLAYVSYESFDKKDVPKQPVIVMHGLFGSKSNWNSLSKTIHQQTDRKVITIDARNHGDSPHSTEMSYKHMAQDIVQLMNDLQLEKAILLGHSMGGSAAMYTALNYPHLVEKLIVVDISPVRTSPNLMGMEKIFKAMHSVNLGGITTLTKARVVAREQLSSSIKSLSLCQFLIMNLVEADVGKFKWRVNLTVLEQNFAQNIAVFPKIDSKIYNGPTLFIGGSKSDYIKVQDHENIKKLFPSSEIIYINDADHWVHVDKPNEFLKITTDFIKRS